MIALILVLLLSLVSPAFAMTREEAKIGHGRPCETFSGMPHENIGCGDGIPYTFNPQTGDWTPLFSYERYRDAEKPCEVIYPPHAPNETGYRTYRTYEVYQLVLFREMCLSWYVMQQPKNHGIWTSRGAPNF
jgi:hypothetical protein